MKWLAAFLLFSAIGLSIEARASTCTKGTDCYCDCVTNNTIGATQACKDRYGGGTTNIYDANYQICQDWEGDEWYEYISAATANWIKPTTGATNPGNRGGAQKWASLYNNGTNGALWHYSQGVPRIGVRCSDNVNGCSGDTEYCSTDQATIVDAQAGTTGGKDCWGPADPTFTFFDKINDIATLDIVKTANDFSDEIGTDSAPTLLGAAQGVFDGKYSLGMRAAIGFNYTCRGNDVPWGCCSDGDSGHNETNGPGIVDFSASGVDVGANTITMVSQAYNTNWGPLWLRDGGGGLPSPLQEGHDYYAIIVNSTHLSLKESVGGSAVDLTTTGGNNNRVFRTGAGICSRGGIAGTANFVGGAKTTFGITEAYAYPASSATSHIFNSPWKHNEWTRPDGGGPDPLLLMHNQASLSERDPFFYEAVFAPVGGGGDSAGQCTTKIAAATVTKGTILCSGGTIWFGASSDTENQYKRSRDWPWETWGCVRQYFEALGTTDSTIKEWFTGPSGVEQEILNITHLDTTGQGMKDGYKGVSFNNYPNVNQNTTDYNSASVNLIQPARRYEDNLHVTAGMPVSCAQIGFFSGEPASPSVSCTNNGPITQGGTATVTATRSNFTGTTANSFTFDMDDDGDIGTCTSAAGGGDSQDDGNDDDCADASDTYCACTKNSSPLSVATHVIDCESHASTPTEDAANTTALQVNAPPAAASLQGVTLSGGVSKQ